MYKDHLIACHIAGLAGSLATGLSRFKASRPDAILESNQSPFISCLIHLLLSQ